MKGYEIKKIVGAYYNVDMDSKSRKREFVRPRQVAHYLCRKYTNLSFYLITRVFPNTKNHTTIIFGVANIEKLLKSDKETISNVIRLEKIIKNK